MEEKTKKCSKCKALKPINNFGVDNRKKSGLKAYCKDCRKNEFDVDKDKERKRKWYLNNRVLSINRSCERQKEKRVERNEYLVKYYKKNPHIYTWRTLIYRTLKGKTKSGSTLELLGYTYNELKHHIEALFTEGMTWDNYGEWHIDHKTPLTSFDELTPVKIVNALSNLQPLWSTTREINGIIYEGNLNKNKKI